MSAWRPSVAEERWLELAGRVRAQRQAPFFAARSGGWRSVGFWTRCAFFLLGLFAAGMTVSLAALLHAPRVPLVAGLALVAVAEWLIRQRRLAAAGIEEALEVAGLVLVALDLQGPLSLAALDTVALVVAAALAIAGLRLLNPLFTTLAALALSLALDFAFTRASSTPGQGAATAASLYCFLIAVLALVAGAARFERPSYDRMFDWLVVALPPAGYMWSAGGRNNFAAVDYLHVHAATDLLTPLTPLAFALAALAIGLRRRTHAPLLGFMIGAACVAFELRALTGWPLEVRLLVWGGAVLAAAVVLERYLRRPRRGITSQQLRDGEGASRLLELAGAAVLLPRAPAQQEARGLEPGGGEFGGGGASGGY